jgi:acetylornithine deacetylase/succinyl-diaminopimelate desuccinylase family protein
LEGLLRTAKRTEDETIQFLQTLVSTQSINPGFPGGEGETKIVEILKERAKKIGLQDIEIHEPVKGRPNFLARIRGTERKPVLVMNGHTDTVPVAEREKWIVDPFSGAIKNGELYGLGSCDMKAGIAAMMGAAQALIDSGEKSRGDLLLFFSAGEEYNHFNGVKYMLQEKRLRADAGINGEPASMREPLDYVHIAARGEVIFAIKVIGQQMHSGLDDIEKPVNAAEKMGKILSRIKKEVKLRYAAPKYGLRPNIIPGVTVRGGQHESAVPGECVFAVDVRILPGMTKEEVLEDFQAFLDKMKAEDPDLKAEIVEFAPGQGIGYGAGSEISEQEPIVKTLQSSYRTVMGAEPKLGCFPGADDAKMMIDAGIPTVTSFGPGFLKFAHGANEHVSLDETKNAMKIYALTALSFLGAT